MGSTMSASHKSGREPTESTEDENHRPKGGKYRNTSYREFTGRDKSLDKDRRDIGQ